MKRSVAVMIAGLLAASVAACSPSGDNARTADVQASGDATLRIGLILDNSGSQSFLNDSAQAAVKLAVKEINDAGGHKGKDVELLPVYPGRDTAEQARRMVEAKADAVIGPTDSSNVGPAVDVLAKAHTVLISPAATANALSTYKSNGYFFRTIATDSAQAPVLVKLAKDGGAHSVAVLHEKSDYGSDVASAVSAAIKSAGLTESTVAEFEPGAAGEAVSKIAEGKPDAVVLIARSGADGAIAELHNAGLSGKKLVLADGGLDNYGDRIAKGALEGASVLVPGAFPSAKFQSDLVAVEPSLKDMSFAAETYDAVNLVAIAAASAQDDAGASIAASLIGVSGPGGPKNDGKATECKNYKDCAALLANGTSVDYQGQSGTVGFDSQGDVTSANFMVFGFGTDNKPVYRSQETAGKASS
ncbi:ABC transporter substrate-binding protein [Pseudarthrobacter sp. J1763]|uniref:ABC transporter substrate-binding protein n=1 Tax=Pseudarthrobacter sp. J1763 TaxID=3420445 RepID=UPI003D2676AF